MKKGAPAPFLSISFSCTCMLRCGASFPNNGPKASFTQCNVTGEFQKTFFSDFVRTLAFVVAEIWKMCKHEPTMRHFGKHEFLERNEITHTRGEQLSVDDFTLWCEESSNTWKTILLSHFRSRRLVCLRDG